MVNNASISVNSSSNEKDLSIDPAVVAQIRQLHFKTKRLAGEVLGGQYRSAFKGRGIEFEEVREYVPGDEIRSIDWKVTARTGKPFIKSFREERELTVLVVVDISSSTRTGTCNMTRESLLAQVGSVLTLIALNNNDKVGLCTYSEQIETYHPPRKGKNSVWRILHEVLSPTSKSQGTDPAVLLSFLSSVLKRNAIVFILSDTFLPNWMITDHAQREKLLTTMQTLAKRHDITVMTAHDPIDDALPKAGLLAIRDPELGVTRIVDTQSANLRKIYLQKSLDYQNTLKTFLSKSGTKHLQLSTSRPFIDDLTRYFMSRSHLLR